MNTGRNSLNGGAPTYTDNKGGINMDFPLGSLIGAGANIFSTIYNTKKQEQANELNWQRAQEMTAQMQAREDTAHQREVADLQAAGLSPLAAVAGANASAPLGYEAQATQMDLSGAIGAMSNIDTITAENMRAREALEENKTIAGANLKENIRQFNINNGIENKKISFELQKIEDTYNKERNEYEMNRIKYYSEELTKDSINMLEKNGIPYQIQYTDNVDDYYSAMNNYIEAINNNMKTLKVIDEEIKNGILNDEVLKNNLTEQYDNKINGKLSAGLASLLGAGIDTNEINTTGKLLETYNSMSAENKLKVWTALMNSGATVYYEDKNGMIIKRNFEKATLPKYIGKPKYKTYTR